MVLICHAAVRSSQVAYRGRPPKTVTALEDSRAGVIQFGAPGATRTPDQRIWNPLLYPLSYRGLAGEYKGRPKRGQATATAGSIFDRGEDLS